MNKKLLFIAISLFSACSSFSQTKKPRFRAIALYENGGHHIEYSTAARSWLDKLAADSTFSIDYIQNTDQINDEYLSHYQLIIQLDYPPYGWKPAAFKAFEKYINQGLGGWIGFHHASLLGEFDGYPLWSWYDNFMGGIRYKDYIPSFVKATVFVDDRSHEVMKGIPASFPVEKEEWYTYDKSPRPNVQVLASVDEKSYSPDSKIKMGDHPVIWTNPRYKARNVYIFMGHSPLLFQNPVYVQLFKNAISWAASDTRIAPRIYLNQVALDSKASKVAVIGTKTALNPGIGFNLVNCTTKRTVFSGLLSASEQVKDWSDGQYFYKADFSAYNITGTYILQLIIRGQTYRSDLFQIGSKLLSRLTLPAIIHYYNKQRANTAPEMEADRHVQLFGSNTRVDLRGGWCDASGDISKYFSHLAYANFMSPQQIPLVTWSMVNTAETSTRRLPAATADSLREEAFWGADYMMRSLSEENYFYMTVFSYFNKDPNARRVVGLHANSVTTNEYQCAFREGGGMAIAALARISRWNKHGSFTSAQYLDGAKRAFAHLLVNNTRYDDDGKENIIDDYCALMAATELWISTDDHAYRNEARKRAKNLSNRLSPDGYFIADHSFRPFWHASDAGLPVVALCRYLKKEQDSEYRKSVLNTIKVSLRYTLKITNNIPNPFGYARQTFRFRDSIKEGFFIPHENETGWWWQGENARLASLATAALTGGKLLYAQDGNKDFRDSLRSFASRQLSWILGCNPYSICFMYGFGARNAPYMHSSFGHGSEKGGISNGITGKDGNADGSGIDFKMSANGNEWRWTEQWLPHAAWFMQVVTAMNEN